MKLQAVYFMPGVSVVTRVTRLGSSISHWSADKHGELKCEEQKNGDVWLTHPDGSRTEISALVISHRVRVQETPVKSEPIRRGVEMKQ